MRRISGELENTFVQALIQHVIVHPQHPLPAPIFAVSYGYEGLEVRSLQTVLQQLLGSVDVLWYTFYTLVQYP